MNSHATLLPTKEERFVTTLKRLCGGLWRRRQKAVYSFAFRPCLTLSRVYFLEWQFLILSSALLLFFSWLCGEFICFFQWSKNHREPQDLFSSALPVTVGEF